MNSSRFLKLTIILLLLINIGTLAFMWVSKPYFEGRPPHNPLDAAHFLVHELNLTDAQQHQYKLLRDEHHEAFEAMREHGHKLRDELFTHLGDTTNNVRVEELADSIAANQKNMDLLTFYHFKKVRAICTPAQQAKFDDVINEALHMMEPPKPPPPPR